MSHFSGSNRYPSIAADTGRFSDPGCVGLKTTPVISHIPPSISGRGNHGCGLWRRCKTCGLSRKRLSMKQEFHRPCAVGSSMNQAVTKVSAISPKMSLIPEVDVFHVCGKL